MLMPIINLLRQELLERHRGRRLGGQRGGMRCRKRQGPPLKNICAKQQAKQQRCQHTMKRNEGTPFRDAWG